MHKKVSNFSLYVKGSYCLRFLCVKTNYDFFLCVKGIYCMFLRVKMIWLIACGIIIVTLPPLHFSPIKLNGNENNRSPTQFEFLKCLKQGVLSRISVSDIFDRRLRERFGLEIQLLGLLGKLWLRRNLLGSFNHKRGLFGSKRDWLLLGGYQKLAAVNVPGIILSTTTSLLPNFPLVIYNNTLILQYSRETYSFKLQ